MNAFHVQFRKYTYTHKKLVNKNSARNQLTLFGTNIKGFAILSSIKSNMLHYYNFSFRQTMQKPFLLSVISAHTTSHCNSLTT